MSTPKYIFYYLYLRVDFIFSYEMGGGIFFEKKAPTLFGVGTVIRFTYSTSLVSYPHSLSLSVIAGGSAKTPS